VLPRPLEGVLFDFDHTLVHLGTHVRWEDARQELRPLYLQAGIPESFIEATPGALGLYGAIGTTEFLPRHRLIEVQRRASAVLGGFEAAAIPHARLIPAVVGLVRALGALRLRMAIITSNAAEVVRAILVREALLERFERITGRDEVAPVLKPAPGGILATCEALGLVPARCVYLGDSASDMAAALGAGATPIGVRGGISVDHELVEAGAVAVLDDVGGLIELINAPDAGPPPVRAGEDR